MQQENSINNQRYLKLTDPIGSFEGNVIINHIEIFPSLNNNIDQFKIKEIFIKEGSLFFEYLDIDVEYINLLTRKQFKTGKSILYSKTFRLKDDEFITAINVYWSSFINGIKFFTNKNNIFLAGREHWNFEIFNFSPGNEYLYSFYLEKFLSDQIYRIRFFYISKKHRNSVKYQQCDKLHKTPSIGPCWNDTNKFDTILMLKEEGLKDTYLNYKIEKIKCYIKNGSIFNLQLYYKSIYDKANKFIKIRVGKQNHSSNMVTSHSLNIQGLIKNILIESNATHITYIKFILDDNKEYGIGGKPGLFSYSLSFAKSHLLGFYGGFSDCIDFLGCYYPDPKDYNYYRRKEYIMLKYRLNSNNLRTNLKENESFKLKNDIEFLFIGLLSLSDDLFIYIMKFF